VIRGAVALAVLAAAAPAHGALRFEREDGTRIPTGKPIVWCGPWADDVATPALHIGTARWHLGAVRRDLVRGRAFTFPHSFVFDRPTKAELFVADGDNEASTEGEDSSGRVFYRRISCRPGRIVEFSIDAVVDSEFSDGDPITVSGVFRGRVGTVTGPIP
jgi:hypothetical protein